METQLQERALMDRMPPGLDNPQKVAAVREELRTLFNTATPQAKKRLLGLVLEKVVVNGTLYADGRTADKHLAFSGHNTFSLKEKFP